MYVFMYLYQGCHFSALLDSLITAQMNALKKLIAINYITRKFPYRPISSSVLVVTSPTYVCSGEGWITAADGARLYWSH